MTCCLEEKDSSESCCEKTEPDSDCEPPKSKPSKSKKKKCPPKLEPCLNRLDPLPRWIKLWFFLSALSEICGFLFMLQGPRYNDGQLAAFFTPFENYQTEDKASVASSVSFRSAVTVSNILAIIIRLVLLIMDFCRSGKTHLLSLVVSTMMFWKTVLYLFNFLPFSDGGAAFGHQSPASLLFILFVPIGMWLVLPFLTMRHSWKQLSLVIYEGQCKKRKKIPDPICKCCHRPKTCECCRPRSCDCRCKKSKKKCEEKPKKSAPKPKPKKCETDCYF